MNLDLKIELQQLPTCPMDDCTGDMLPFPDFIQGTEKLFLRGWCCSSCDHNIVMKSGSFERLEVKGRGVGK